MALDGVKAVTVAFDVLSDSRRATSSASSPRLAARGRWPGLEHRLHRIRRAASESTITAIRRGAGRRGQLSAC